MTAQSEASLLIATNPAEPVTHPKSSQPLHAYGGRALRTTTKRNAVRRRRYPVRDRRRANLIMEANHTRERNPAVLAEPAVDAAGVLARAVPAVGRARVVVAVRERGEDGRLRVALREREDVCEHVAVVRGVHVHLVGVLSADADEEGVS